MCVILLFFFSLHRNSPTFKSFEEKVENLKASKEQGLFVILFGAWTFFVVGRLFKLEFPFKNI